MTRWRTQPPPGQLFIIRPVDLDLCPIIDEIVETDSDEEISEEEEGPAPLDGQDEVTDFAEFDALDKAAYEPGVFVWYRHHFARRLRRLRSRFVLSSRSLLSYWTYVNTASSLSIGGGPSNLRFPHALSLGIQSEGGLSLLNSYYDWWHWEGFVAWPGLGFVEDTGTSLIIRDRELGEPVLATTTKQRKRKLTPSEIYQAGAVAFTRSSFNKLLWAIFQQKPSSPEGESRSELVDRSLPLEDLRRRPVLDEDIPDWLHISHLHAGDSMPDTALDREIVIEGEDDQGLLKKTVVSKIPGSHIMAVTGSYKLYDEIHASKTMRDESVVTPGQVARVPVAPSLEEAAAADLAIQRTLWAFSTGVLWDAIGPIKMTE